MRIACDTVDDSPCLRRLRVFFSIALHAAIATRLQRLPRAAAPTSTRLAAVAQRRGSRQ